MSQYLYTCPLYFRKLEKVKVLRWTKKELIVQFSNNVTNRYTPCAFDHFFKDAETAIAVARKLMENRIQNLETKIIESRAKLTQLNNYNFEGVMHVNQWALA